MRRWAAGALTVLVLVLVAPAARAVPASEDCLGCHGDRDLTATDAAGQEVSAFVDGEVFGRSAHGGLACVDCHAGVAEAEHAPDLAPVACAACHEDEVKEVAASDHGRGGDRPGAKACTICHGGPHRILAAGDPESATYRSKIPATCAVCHDGAGSPQVGMAEPIAAYARTVHGRALLERGNLEAATCTDCHGAHDLDRAATPRSKVNRGNIAATCSKCHSDVASTFGASIHGQALARGVGDVPTCTDCHGEHTILAHKDPASTVFATTISRETCAACHGAERLAIKFGIPGRRVESYRESYHGLASEAGVTTVANCASCHGVHDILPSSDARSTIHPRNLPATCGKCHPGVSEAVFTGLTIHGGPEGGVPIVRWVVRFYRVLIPLVIGGMLAHHALDFGRKLRRHVRRARAAPAVMCWTSGERIEHAVLLVSFIALAYSGFAIKFPQASWGAPFHWLGGESFRSNFHRVFALVFVVLGFEHVVRLVACERGRRLLAGMAFRASDVGHAIGFLTGRARSMHAEDPRQFSYVAKAEYWALVWGAVVMSLTGAALVFKNWTLAHLPTWVPDFSTYVHYYEAVLATLAIIVWHLYSVIFDPEVYPLDTAMLTGKAAHGAGHEESGEAGPAPGNPALRRAAAPVVKQASRPRA